MQHSGVAIIQTTGNDAAKSPSRQDVFRMFDRIAHRYDFLNRLLSFGQDIRWRKKLAHLLGDNPSQHVLDLATGTADVLIGLKRYSNRVALGVGLDMAGNMLAVGKRKIARANHTSTLSLLRADAVALPMVDKSFDSVSMAFGIRNVVDISAVLKEMHRVLKDGGKVLILEFSLPPNILIRKLHLFYLRHLLPFIGGIISGDRTAYEYLNRTIETFPYGEEFKKLMNTTGFKNVRAHRVTFGVATIYEGER